MLVLKILAEQLFINGDKMKRLVPNAVPITSNYEEITLWEEIVKISTDDTITGENLLILKTNIEMRLGSQLQEMLYLSWKCPPRVSFNSPEPSRASEILSVMSTAIFLSLRWF
jgi:hypothetical protein